MRKRRRVFVDLDGVLFDFDGHFEQCFDGKQPPSKNGVNDEEMWQLVHGHGSFFRTMPLFPGAKDFFDTLVGKGFDPIVLTAASKNHYHDMAVQKRAAVREHLSEECLILPVWGSSSKTLFMHGPGDVLIDDYSKNIKRWNDAGGTGIFHTDFTTSMLKLGMIWGMDSRNEHEGKPFQNTYLAEEFIHG